jgi:hypothetical protein
MLLEQVAPLWILLLREVKDDQVPELSGKISRERSLL